MLVRSYLKWTITLPLIAFLFETANGIKCYQCNSTDTDKPYQCTEFMTGSEDIEAEPCTSVYNAQFCIKFTGRHEEGWGTMRYCSSLDLGNFCSYGSQQGDQLDYRSCVYTCSTDGCNLTSSNKPFILSVLMAFALLVKVLL